MIRRLTIRRTTSSLIAAATLSLLVTACSLADAQDIPARAERRAGRLILSDRTEARIELVVAGFWGRQRVTLYHEGAAVWRSPLLDGYIATGGWDGRYKFVRLDVDANGRPDWLALFIPIGYSASATSAYEEDFDGTRAWSDEESRRELASPWRQTLCSGLSGLIVLDDEKTAYAFNYDRAPDPFMHGNPYVQGAEHYRMVASGAWRKDRLEVTSPIPAPIWSSIRRLVEERACNTPDVIDKSSLPADQRIQWDLKPEPYGLDWRPYFAEGLAMYGRAKSYYESRKADMPREDRGTKRALGVFDLHAFFRAFPFDEIDPENKSPEYTAMINDFAFYQMAPEDANEAVGFENVRKPVDQGVVAMLAHVIRRDPQRTGAYLNLADALWRNSKDAQAAVYYSKYNNMMKAAGRAAQIPKRAIRRAEPPPSPVR